MTALEVLKGAYRLFDDRSRWTQDVSARNASGEQEANALGNYATSWCALGGIYKVAGGDTEEFRQARKVLAKTIHPDHKYGPRIEWMIVANANDNGGYDVIREALREAIAQLSDEKPVREETPELVAV